MAGQVLVRDFTCAVCGAPRMTRDDAVVVLCRSCGGLLCATGAEGAYDYADRHARGIRDLVKPSQASARLTTLSVELARAEGDRVVWRLLCEEQVLLMAIAHPNLVPPIPVEPARRAAYVRQAVAMQEIASFDPSVRLLMSRYGAACGDLARPSRDPVDVARAMLAAARAYYGALASHPDAPPGMLREGPEHHAKELVRSSIQGYAPLLGDGVVEQIRVEVLGDALRSAGDVRCPKCGAPLPVAEGTSLSRCAHCEAVTSVSVQDDETDAWMSARLALWQVSLGELVRDGRLDGPTPVLAAVGGFLYTSAADVEPDKAVRFLARAIPWVARADVERGLDLLLDAVADDPRRRALLEGIRAATRRSWVSDPSGRPAQAVQRRSPHPPPSEADEAAWIESALALWSMRRGSLLDLLGQAVVAMHVAAVNDQPAGVSPRAAIAFFERAVPGFDRAAMLVEVARLRPGYDHPRVASFLAELAELLSSSR